MSVIAVVLRSGVGAFCFWRRIGVGGVFAVDLLRGDYGELKAASLCRPCVGCFGVVRLRPCVGIGGE